MYELFRLPWERNHGYKFIINGTAVCEEFWRAAHDFKKSSVGRCKARIKSAWDRGYAPLSVEDLLIFEGGEGQRPAWKKAKKKDDMNSVKDESVRAWLQNEFNTLGRGDRSTHTDCIYLDPCFKKDLYEFYKLDHPEEKIDESTFLKVIDDAYGHTYMRLCAYYKNLTV